MKFLLVKEKGIRIYTLYCPDTYGSETWGSGSFQTQIKKNANFGMLKLGFMVVNC